MILHITNGDVFANRLSGLRMQGVILPWREILHEGTIPKYASFSEDGRRAFNTERSRLIAERGWGEESDTLFEMMQRDELLLSQHWSEIVLWFERDLFDQLQLAHILTLLKGAGVFREPGITLVFSNKHLSKLTDDEVIERYSRRSLIDETLARHYCDFFESLQSSSESEPERSAPQALIDAHRKFGELKPDNTGLSLLDRRITEIVKVNRSVAKMNVLRQINLEDGDDAFLGDLGFLWRLTELVERSSDLEINGDVVKWVGS